MVISFVVDRLHAGMSLNKLLCLLDSIYSPSCCKLRFTKIVFLYSIAVVLRALIYAFLHVVYVFGIRATVIFSPFLFCFYYRFIYIIIILFSFIQKLCTWDKFSKHITFFFFLSFFLIPLPFRSFFLSRGNRTLYPFRWSLVFLWSPFSFYWFSRNIKLQKKNFSLGSRYTIKSREILFMCPYWCVKYFAQSRNLCLYVKILYLLGGGKFSLICTFLCRSLCLWRFQRHFYVNIHRIVALSFLFLFFANSAWQRRFLLTVSPISDQCVDI